MSFPKPFYRWRPHPWHGLPLGSDAPSVVTAYIEITPFDLMKYEVDKETGYMRVDRPQRSSSQSPALYGFVPRTYCGERVGKLMPAAQRGDGDPLDICVFSERPVTKSEVVLQARVIGGLPMCDGGEADDKIIAVLEGDNVWKDVADVDEFPDVLVERLRHYFLTYKLVPGEANQAVIGDVYGREQAEAVIRAAAADYDDQFGND